MRPDVVAGVGGLAAAGHAELGGTVAAAALEDDLEEVDDAVLVGVEVAVVDVGVGHDGGVVGRLRGRAAAGVDGLQRAERGLVRGQIWAEDGTLVASVVQEGVLRVRPLVPSKL